MARIEDWYMAWTGDAYTPPEMRGKAIVGRVFGLENFTDGEEIKTGSIAKSEGRIVTTHAGEVFELGKPEPAYIAWLKSTGIPFDEANPIKLVDEYKYATAEGARPLDGGRRG